MLVGGFSCFRTNYQYVRAIDVLNWKPPPPVPSSVDTPLQLPPSTSNVFLSNRTFLTTVVEDKNGNNTNRQLLVCVTPDEGDIYKRQLGFIGSSSSNSIGTSGTSGTSGPRTLREFWQTISLIKNGGKGAASTTDWSVSSLWLLRLLLLI